MSFTDDNFLKRQIPMSIRNLADDKSTNVALFGDVQNMDDIERDFDIVLSLLKYGADEIGEFSRDGWSVDIRADYEGEGPLVFGENRDQVYFWIKKQKKSKLWPFGKRELVILYKPANGEDYEALDPFVQKEGGALFFEFWNMLKKDPKKGFIFLGSMQKQLAAPRFWRGYRLRLSERFLITTMIPTNRGFGRKTGLCRSVFVPSETLPSKRKQTSEN